MNCLLKSWHRKSKRWKRELQQQLRKSIASDYDNELRILQQNIQENEERIKQARQKEYEYLKKEQELKNKEHELEIQLQKKLMEERHVLHNKFAKKKPTASL